ncbi:choline ABC transporter substrate-binding protein [Derxia gummosa]|uniref:Choline ABC transporter substrate-binding protein n=1 Tax=Derxia gummosa DSM 723 TaxID=1121388 RepID=A0A8B6X7K7_9BURK|nr:choline ABC transporter substrate-binding protein [Derxia gummosa]
MNLRKLALGTAIAAVAAASSTAFAADPAACRKVRFADVGWTDITATTGAAMAVLDALGYQPTKQIASVPITFAGLKKKQLDVFLGYWNPSMTPMIEPFVKDGSLKVLDEPNLVGAKYTLAVPDYVAAMGLKSFQDIAKFKDQLDGKIYGIEPGNDGNQLIADMIKKNQYGLKDFKLVESSEAAMLVELGRAEKAKKPIVFLGWEPHPMNVQHKMVYLTGGDDSFGPNYGEAKVFTVLPADYATRCPNVAKLVTQMHFTTDMENRLMAPIMDKKDPVKVAKDYIKANPGVLDKWLDGVTTFDGKEGLASVKKGVGL